MFMELRQLALGVAKGRAKYPTSYHWGPWRAILMSISLLVMFAALPQLIGSPEGNGNWPLYVSLASIAWLATFFVCSYGQFKTPYLLTTAFVVPLCLFHLGVVIPSAFGWSPDAGLTFGSFAPWLERAGWYTVLALGCIGLGFGWSLKRSNFKIQKHIVDEATANRVLDMLFLNGIGLLIASVIFLGLAIASFGNLLSYSRVDFVRINAGDTRGLGALTMVLPIALIFLVVGARKRMTRIFSYSITAFLFIILLLSGSRSAVMAPLLVGIVLWVKVGKKIPLPVALTILVFVLIAIPAIGVLRSSGESYDKINKEDILRSTENAKIGTGFSEMGSTASVLANILRLVPEKDPYRYGESYFKAIKVAIPNIGLSQKGSERLMALQGASATSDAVLDLIPSEWITYRLDPIRFAAGEGVGFSGIGEPYINFGLTGVVIYFIFLGFFLGRLESANLLSSPKVLIFIAVTAVPLITLVRNDFVIFTKPVIFTYIVLLIWNLSTKFLFGKNRSAGRI
jgi:oligosaccharide repeat unit polymerase